MRIEYEEKELDIIRREIVATFNKLKHNKSQGSDGIISKMPTALCDPGVENFHNIWVNDTT